MIIIGLALLIAIASIAIVLNILNDYKWKRGFYAYSKTRKVCSKSY